MTKLGIVYLTALLLVAPGGPASAATCSFNSSPQPLSFGNLDPGIGADVVVTANLTVLCGGSGPPPNINLSDDDGLYKTGVNANRMINSTCPLGTAYLPYSLTYLSPVAGKKNQTITVTVTGTVLGSVYQDACLGVYNDTVTFTVSP